MAKTSFATGNALTKKLWEEKLFRDMVKDSYFQRFMGEDSNSPVQVKSKLDGKQGDKITFGIRMRLTGSGVTSGQQLEGNEEALTTYDFSASLERYRHAVRDNGDLDRQRPMFDIDAEAEQAIKDWGSEKITSLCMTALLASPTKILYGGSATGTGDITTSDKLTPALISKVKAGAKGGWGRTYVPFRPIKISGKEYFVLLVHPDVMYDLKNDSTFAQAMREAEVRGKENPLFTGAAAIWDGVVIHEHEDVSIVTNWGAGSNVPGAKCVLFGAQALVWGWGKRPRVIYKTFDYEEEHGWAIAMTNLCAKPVFNSLDYGSCGVYVARTQIN